MGNSVPAAPGLDELAAGAIAGDRQAEESLFATLRVRFLDLAKRRVRDADAQDVVQEALRIVHSKYRTRGRPDGVLVFGLAVLRNVVGNYYQSRRREERMLSLDEDRTVEEAASRMRDGSDGPALGLEGGPAPWDSTEAVEAIGRALADLSRSHPRCGAIFRAILESLAQGGGAREVSGRAADAVVEAYPGMSRGSFYVALHRCRSRLRAILDEAGNRREAGPGAP